MKKHSKWIVSSISIILFLLIGLYLINIEDNIADKTIYNLIISTKSNTMTTILSLMTLY